MRQFAQLNFADLTDLCQFLKRIDAAVNGRLESVHAYGHSDLAGYLPWMGPRYRHPGHEVPLSIFRGEGMALFLLARLIHPTVIAECYTGTGYSAMFLAAGWSQARVVSVDNYMEGGMGEDGRRNAENLRDELGLTNLELIRGVASDLTAALNGQQADLFFSDGPYGEAPPLTPDVVVVRQDDTDGQVPERRFGVRGGSHLSVMCATVDERDALAKQMGTTFPVQIP